MPTIPFTDFANLPTAERNALSEVVTKHYGLDQIFAWGRTQSPPIHPADVIKQDEFTHDVLVPLPGDRWLVYGTTGLGAVKAVSVWDHKPDASEIQQKRLASGWKPIASQLKHGDVVEGYAACVFQPGEPSGGWDGAVEQGDEADEAGA